MRMTSKGQVTVPLPIRERSGLVPGSEVEFEIDEEGVVRLRRKGDSEQPRNAALEEAIGRMRGSATAGMSTEEIMALTRG